MVNDDAEEEKVFPYRYVKELREENRHYRKLKIEAERERDKHKAEAAAANARADRAEASLSQITGA